MRLDVVDLRDFYYGSRLGAVARDAVRAQLMHLWPDPRGGPVLGFGFALPVLRPFLGRAERVIALMPGRQGVLRWPEGGDNVSVLCGETRWPVQSGLADRLVLLHALETSERPDAMLEECGRVLAPTGRAVIVVPNRSGMWARSEATPFGTGRPYTLGQLEAQLRRHGLEPVRHLAALFFPPSERRFWLRSAPACERVGRRISSYFAGGVLLVEATKSPETPGTTGLRETVRDPLPVREGVVRPV